MTHWSEYYYLLFMKCTQWFVAWKRFQKLYPGFDHLAEKNSNFHILYFNFLKIRNFETEGGGEEKLQKNSTTNFNCWQINQVFIEIVTLKTELTNNIGANVMKISFKSSVSTWIFRFNSCLFCSCKPESDKTKIKQYTNILGFYF